MGNWEGVDGTGGKALSKAERAQAEREMTALKRSLQDIAVRTAVLTASLEGKTLEVIAAELGVDKGTVVNHRRRALDELARENRSATERMRALEGARLDAAHAAIWQDVLKGDLRAIETMLSISTKRRSLFALDKTPPPVPVALTDGAGGPVRFTLAFDRTDGGAEEKADTSVIEGESLRLLPAAGEEGG